MSQTNLQNFPAGCSFPRGTRLVFVVNRTVNGRKVKGHKVAKLSLPKRVTSAEVVAMRDTLHRAAVYHAVDQHADPLGFVSRFAYADYDEQKADLDHSLVEGLAA